MDIMMVGAQLAAYAVLIVMFASLAIATFIIFDATWAAIRKWLSDNAPPEPLSEPVPELVSSLPNSMYSLAFDASQSEAIYIVARGIGIDERMLWYLDVKNVDILRSQFDQWALRKAEEKHDSNHMTEHEFEELSEILKRQS